MRNRSKTAAWLALVVLFLPPTPSDAQEEGRAADRLINDCGVNSLYLILMLQSKGVDLSEVRRSLPSTERDGLSISEIRAASERHGVRLRVRKLGTGDFPMDRPAIALFKAGERMGHFVVLEPVGVTGKMVTVLDFPRPPRIVSYAELTRDDGWDGLALVPETFWERSASWIVSGMGVFLIILGVAFPSARRFAKARRPSSIGTESAGLVPRTD